MCAYLTEKSMSSNTNESDELKHIVVFHKGVYYCGCGVCVGMSLRLYVCVLCACMPARVCVCVSAACA